VTDLWIVNASPVISLAKIGYLHLLEELAPDLLMPDAVAAEIRAGASSDPARKALEAGWGRFASPKKMPTAVAEWSLGAGESAVLALGLEHEGCSTVLDDGAARNCARTLGIPVLGTLGIVLRAKRSGLIPSAVAVLEALLNSGFRLNNSTIRAALQKATGDDWPH
jgi:predicted nucleic acid-binding protein